MASKVDNRLITQHLERLATQVVDTILNPDATVTEITRAEKLAEVIWQRANGWEEKLANGEVKFHKPETWAIAHILERLEGRVKIVEGGDEAVKKGRIRERMRELTRSTINDITDTVTGSDSEGAVSEYPSDMDGPIDGAEGS
jgi:hypothetical protein